MEKMAWDGPKWGQEDFFLPVQTLPTFWAEGIWILRSFLFLFFWIPTFWISRSTDFQVPRSRTGPGLGGLGPARALLRGGSTVAPRHSRTTKLVRSKEPGQYRENPISASPVWGMRSREKISVKIFQFNHQHLRNLHCHVFNVKR